MQEIFHQKEYDAALYYYELAQSEEPDNEMIVYDMAYLHYLLNELQVAVDYFTLAIELKPDFELAIHNRAKLIEKSKFKEIFNGANVWLTSLSA